MKDSTYTTFILDESDNMIGIKQNVIDTYNAYIKNNHPNILATFNSKVVFRLDSPILILNDMMYNPSGVSALYDAIGKTISMLGLKFASMQEQARPNNVILVILTTGIDTGSVKFSHTIVDSMIKHQKEKYNWKFVFLDGVL